MKKKPCVYRETVIHMDQWMGVRFLQEAYEQPYNQQSYNQEYDQQVGNG